jgi:uncharacterized protein (TIGR02246 family)
MTAPDDRIAIGELLADYALTLDADDIDACLDLFTDTGEFVVYGETLIGRERIAGMMTRAPKGMHLTGATHVAVRGDTATASSQVLFVDSTTHGMRPALYDDDLIKTPDGAWRFQRRRCRFITPHGLADSPNETVNPAEQ